MRFSVFPEWRVLNIIVLGLQQVNDHLKNIYKKITVYRRESQNYFTHWYDDSNSREVEKQEKKKRRKKYLKAERFQLQTLDGLQVLARRLKKRKKKTPLPIWSLIILLFACM